jgi:cyclophilin family peptidyl-prolyl cis-trans isomerase
MKIKTLTLIIGVILVLSSCGNGSPKKSNDSKSTDMEVSDTVKKIENMEKKLAFDTALLSEEPVFEIKTTEGVITVKLYKETPLHRDNFIKLASEQFYDGILFHRIIKNFMIQTGDPLSKDASKASQWGVGGPGYTIPAEILPQFKHKKGALAAARRGNAANPKMESSGSQFYIVESAETCAQLDGQYTIFGETISGLDVIDKIAAAQTNAKDQPVNEIRIISILPINK